MNSRGSGPGKTLGSVNRYINRIGRYENWLIEQVRLKRRSGYALDALGWALMGTGMLLGAAMMVGVCIFTPVFVPAAIIFGLPICFAFFAFGMFSKNKGKEILKAPIITSVNSETVESLRAELNDIKEELSYSYLFSQMNKVQADAQNKLVECSVAQAQAALDKIGNGSKYSVTTIQQVLQEVVEPVCWMDEQKVDYDVKNTSNPPYVSPFI